MENTSAPTSYLIEEEQDFAASTLWELQRLYFSARGADAWREGEVPHYVTSNPTIAQAYAETVFAFYQDRQRLHPDSEAMTICELGAGSGRFAFHFLQHLTELCAQHQLAAGAFRYVLTDFTQVNLDSWRAHPAFSSWFAQGLLDLALFDVGTTEQLALQVSGQVLQPGSLRHPLVVLANYVFDGVPQDLLYFQHQQAYDGLVTLSSSVNPGALAPMDLLGHVALRYSYRASTEPRYAEPALQALLEPYRAGPDKVHVLFPAAALRALMRLRALSAAGMLLLSADKGDYRLAEVARHDPPEMARHGSFSLTVNYHAMTRWCEQQGGIALYPRSGHQHICVVGLLLVSDAAMHMATRHAFGLHIHRFGPDAFYTLAARYGTRIAAMEFDEIVAFMQFNRGDAFQLGRLVPRLAALIPALTPGQRSELAALVHATWQRYFPLGEEHDLAFDLARLFYCMDDFAAALCYFDKAQEKYGRHEGILFNMAVCQRQLGQFDAARALLEALLELSPEHSAGKVLLESLSRPPEAAD